MVSLHKFVSIKQCRHDRGICPYAHNFQDYRRDPRKKYYSVSIKLLSLKTAPTG